MAGPFNEVEFDAMSFGRDWRAGNLGIQGSDGGTQALGDHLRVMLESSLGVGVPQVALHVLGPARRTSASPSHFPGNPAAAAPSSSAAGMARPLAPWLTAGSVTGLTRN